MSSASTAASCCSPTNAHLPYERPALSKAYLRGESGRVQLAVHGNAFYADHDVEVRTGTAVARIDRSGRTVVTSSGDRVAYTRLLIATGAAPRRLSIPGADLAGIHQLRTVDDADRLRHELTRATNVVVVGGGWIGSEVAASARQLGCAVTMLHHGAAPLEAVLGPEVAAVYRDVHTEHGVVLEPDANVEAFRGGTSVEEVVTSRGTDRSRSGGRRYRRPAPRRARVRGGAGRARRDRSRRAPPHERRQRVRGGRRRLGPSPALRDERAGRALGQRSEPRPRRGPEPGGWSRGLRPAAVLLLRPVRRRHGVRRIRTRVGPRRRARQHGGARVHRLLDQGRPGGRGDERQRLGCRRSVAAADSRHERPCTTTACAISILRSIRYRRDRRALSADLGLRAHR